MGNLYIARDGQDEPSLWACDVTGHDAETCDCTRPKQLTRMCDVGNERAWSVLCVGVMAINGGAL